VQLAVSVVAARKVGPVALVVVLVHLAQVGSAPEAELSSVEAVVEPDWADRYSSAKERA
jgi:hypothetical protein